jgi:hypothetical protein
MTFPGRSPPARHKHSATLVWTGSTPTMWIFGGMENNPPLGFNDLYCLTFFSPAAANSLTNSTHSSSSNNNNNINNNNNNTALSNHLSVPFPNITTTGASYITSQSNSMSTNNTTTTTTTNNINNNTLNNNTMVNNSNNNSVNFNGGAADSPRGFVSSVDINNNSNSNNNSNNSNTHLKSTTLLSGAELEHVLSDLYEHLDQFPLPDLERIETFCLQSMLKLSHVKKEKLYQLWSLTDNSPLLSHGSSSMKNNNNGDSLHSSDVIESLQSENIKLRNKLREYSLHSKVNHLNHLPNTAYNPYNSLTTPSLGSGISHTNNNNSNNNNNGSNGVVGFSHVSTIEFLPSHGQGVPSGGAAPLGMEMRPFHRNVESIINFEQRRENSRRGVTRISEAERIHILRDVGQVSEDSLVEEAQLLEQINRQRIESIASPTENPLPEQQRDMYRRMLNEDM